MPRATTRPPQAGWDAAAAFRSNVRRTATLCRTSARFGAVRPRRKWPADSGRRYRQPDRHRIVAGRKTGAQRKTQAQPKLIDVRERLLQDGDVRLAEFDRRTKPIDVDAIREPRAR